MGKNCDLFFPYPEQKEADRNQIKQVLNIFKNTLDALPFGNQEKTAKEIFDILYKSNKIKLTGDDRLSLLKDIECKAPQVVAGLKEKIKDVTVPVGRREERVAKILVALHYELALSYRCLLSQQPTIGLLGKANKSEEIDSIRHTIFHLGEILRTKYSVFANTSGTIWKYIYTLYICASNQNVNDYALSSSSWCDYTTVDEVFKSILLMSLSSPQTMRGKEFSALYDLAPELTQYINLGKINCGESYPGLMTFNLSGTESPKKQFATGCDSCSNSSNCFTVDTSTLLKHIDDQQEKIQSSNQLTPLQRILSNDSQYQRLKRNLAGHERVDHENRIKGEGIIELVAGFSDICTFLSKRSDDEAANDDENTDSSNWTTIGEEESITVKEKVDWTATGIVRAGLRKTTCNVINHSSGGYCLYKDAGDKFYLRVGELAIVKESEKNNWRLVEVIWVSGNRERMDFGVKVLDGTISIGTVRSINQIDPDKTVDGLFLNMQNGAEQKQIRVITSSPDFSKGDRIVANFQGAEHQGSVLDINSKTDGYVEYICDCSGRGSTETDAQDIKLGESVAAETDFESIWDKI